MPVDLTIFTGKATFSLLKKKAANKPKIYPNPIYLGNNV